MQVAVAIGVLVLAFAALANSAPMDEESESKAVKLGEGAKAIMVQQVENRRRERYRNKGNWNVKLRKEFANRRYYYPARFVMDDNAFDNSVEDYDGNGSDENEEVSEERPVYRRRYGHARRPRHHGYAYGHGRRYVH